VVDRSWNLVYVTEDQRLTYGAGTAIDLPLGGHFLGPELLAAFQRSTYGANTTALLKHQLRSLGGLALADVGGVRLRDESGRVVWTAMVCKPAAGMATLASVIPRAIPATSPAHAAGLPRWRRPAAILLADLEGSTPLSRRLSTASYFSLGRRWCALPTAM
jgi:hypothetical protein